MNASTTDAQLQKLLNGRDRFPGLTRTHDHDQVEPLILDSQMLAPSLTADQNDYSPVGLSQISVLYLDATADRSITGIVAPARRGRVLIIQNVSTHILTFVTDSGLSAAANQMHLPHAANITLLSNESLTLMYSHQFLRWEAIATTASGGIWTDVTFNAADFTATTGNWTLTSPDQVQFSYVLFGKTMIVTFVLDATTVSATPVALQIKIPGGKTAARRTDSANLTYNDNVATVDTGYMRVGFAGDTVISLFRNYNGLAWSTATNTTYVNGTFTFEVQ